jgi:hypothetical protein
LLKPLNKNLPPLPPAADLLASGVAALLGGRHTGAPVDWDAAVPLYAQRHGLVAWLPKIAARTAAVPAAALAAAESMAREHALRALTQLGELNAILRPLTAELPVVILKGPALSAWLYDDACARRFSDFDLLVPRADRDRAAEILESLGFHSALSRDGLHAVYGATGAWPFYREGATGVDLHWRLAARRFQEPVGAEEVFAHSQSMVVGDVTVRVPCAEHTAALVLTHAAKHVWYSLETVMAIAALAKRDDVDWRAVDRLLCRAGGLRAAAVGFALAESVFGVPAPSLFAARARRVTTRQLASGYATLSLPPHVFPDRWLLHAAQRATFDRVRDRLAYDLRTLLEPTSLEWQWVQLRAPLTPLYVPLRLVRLALAAVR